MPPLMMLSPASLNSSLFSLLIFLLLRGWRGHSPKQSRKILSAVRPVDTVTLKLHGWAKLRAEAQAPVRQNERL